MGSVSISSPVIELHLSEFTQWNKTNSIGARSHMISGNGNPSIWFLLTLSRNSMPRTSFAPLWWAKQRGVRAMPCPACVRCRGPLSPHFLSCLSLFLLLPCLSIQNYACILEPALSGYPGANAPTPLPIQHFSSRGLVAGTDRVIALV